MLRVILLNENVPGGITRLVSGLLSTENNKEVEFILFETHGKLAESIIKFPYRLVKLAYVARSCSIDLCHMNLASRGSTLRMYLLALVCRFVNLPFLLHLHGALYRDFFRDMPRIVQRLLQQFFRRSARVIVLGKVWREFVVDELGVEPTRVVILPNAVSGPKRVTIPEGKGPIQILFLGRIGTRKGAPELIEALCSRRLSSLQWTAVIAGDGEGSEYINKVERAGLSDRIVFTGWIDPETVEQYLRQSSILALPSHAENLPLSMLEGMAFGLVPVVTPVGAVADVIQHGENGLLIPKCDAVALADAIARLIEDPVLRRRLATNARADFELRYNIDDYRQKLAEIYHATMPDCTRTRQVIG